MQIHANQKTGNTMTEQSVTPETDTEYGEETALAVNPFCEKDAAGRPCINTAGHELDCIPAPLTDAEKLDYVFRKFLEIDALIEQAGPLLDQAAPLLATFGGAGAGQSSPLGRIAGSLFR